MANSRQNKENRKNALLNLCVTIPNMIKKIKIPGFNTLDHSLSSQDQIMNVFESSYLTWLKN